MDITITPALLTGSVTPPPSKSQAHRLIIAAALSSGVSMLENVAFSQDIQATLSCMEVLGARWARLGSGVRMEGIFSPGAPRPAGTPVFDCGESGSTLRFLIPIALAAAGGGRFSGRGRLMERPQQPYFDLFAEKGIFCEQRGGVLTVRGTLSPGEFRLPGNVSSQFITGLLYALPLLPGNSSLVLTTPLESEGYVFLTLDVLRKFGVNIAFDADRFVIPGMQPYLPRETAVEADWSQAGFWYAAAGLGNRVEVLGMDPLSRQGDRVIAAWEEALRGPGDFSLDISHCPDLAPPLAAWAAGRSGVTFLKNAARLRIKESDRIAAIAAVLGAMGARVEEGADSLAIHGGEVLPGGAAVDAFNDHRIAMMAAIAATRCAAPVTVRGAECVAKSYPDFWDVYESLGGHLARHETFAAPAQGEHHGI